MVSGKLDDWGSIGLKWPRNTNSQSDGDWICSHCGNVNFRFTTCDTAARRSPIPRMGSTPGPDIVEHHSHFNLCNVGAPLPAPLRMSGSRQLFSETGYGFELPSNAPKPHGLYSSYGPHGEIAGMEFGTRTIMDRYGYGFQGSALPATGLCSSGDLPDNNASQKHYRGPPDFQGCWSCFECNNLNFSFSNTCNMRKCGAPRPTTASHLETGQLASPMLSCRICEKLTTHV